MKTAEKIMKQTDNIKSFGNMMGKAGYGMKMAANLGYKIGYNMAKHPNLEKVKKHINKHPRTSIMALIGTGIAVAGILAYFMRNK